MDCQKMDLMNRSKDHFSRHERSEKFKFGYFTTFWPLSQKRSDKFSLFYVYNFLGMILVN